MVSSVRTFLTLQECDGLCRVCYSFDAFRNGVFGMKLPFESKDFK